MSDSGRLTTSSNRPWRRQSQAHVFRICYAPSKTRELEGPSQSEGLAPVAEMVGGPANENPTLGRIGASELIPPFARAQTQPWPPSSAAAPRPGAAPQPRLRRPPPIVGSPDGSRTSWRLPRDEPEETASKGAETLEALSREISGLIDDGLRLKCGIGAPRRYRRCFATPLHGGRSTSVRRASATLSRRPPVPGDDNPLYAGVRAPIVEDRQNDRDGAQWRAYLLSNTQGLHDPRARLGEAGLGRANIQFTSKARGHLPQFGRERMLLFFRILW